MAEAQRERRCGADGEDGGARGEEEPGAAGDERGVAVAAGACAGALGDGAAAQPAYEEMLLQLYYKKSGALPR